MSTPNFQSQTGSNTNFSEALQKAQQYISQNPNDYLGYVHYGDVFMDMDNCTKAIENYEKALAIKPDDASTFFKLGNAYEMKEELQSAQNQYQTARRLDPANTLYLGYYGRLLNMKGLTSGNSNFENEGLSLMEQAYAAGEKDASLQEQLSIAHLEQAMSSWRKHPEKEGYVVATEQVHLQHAKTHLDWARGLSNPANQAISKRISEIQEIVAASEKREFAGYAYLRKVPFITALVLLVFGFKIAAIIMVVLGVLYHISQIKPNYMVNQQLFKDDYRDPFIVRRLNQMDRELSGITIFSSSWSGLFFNKFLFNLVGGTIRFGMVLMMLPYEIVKGFIKNYGGQTSVAG